MDSSSASRVAARRPWSAAEDAALRRLVAAEGPRRWDSLAKRLPGPGRGGKSCRLRWRHHLHPAVSKRPFAAQEDRIIVGAFSAIGPKWAEMAKSMEGRTDGSIKNRWHSHLKKKYPALLAKYLAEDAYQANVLTLRQHLYDNDSEGVEFSAQNPENIASIQEHPGSLVHSDDQCGSPEIASHSQNGESQVPTTSTVHISPSAGGSNTQLPSFLSTNCVDQQPTSYHGGWPTGTPSLDHSFLDSNTPCATSPSPASVTFLHSPNKKTAELLRQGSSNMTHATSAKSSVEFTSQSWSPSTNLEHIMTSSWQSSTLPGGLPLDRTFRQEKNASQFKHSFDRVQNSLLEIEDKKPSTQVMATSYNIPPPASASSSMAALPPSIQQFADGNFFVNSGIRNSQVSDWEESSMDLSDSMTNSALQVTTNQDTMSSLLDILFMASNSQSCGTSSSLDCLQEDSHASTLETVMLEELIWTDIPSRDILLPPPLVDGNASVNGGPPYFVDLPPLNREYDMNMPH